MKLWSDVFTFNPYELQGLTTGLPDPQPSYHVPWNLRYFPDLIVVQIKTGSLAGKWLAAERENFIHGGGRLTYHGHGWRRNHHREIALRDFFYAAGILERK